MILADKIVRLRKQAGWSQEELAEQLDVSRQSVSKWESAQSIPDLNKIIAMAEIFEVSTDFLLKDDVQQSEPATGSSGLKPVQISLERTNEYLDEKISAASLIAKGVFLCVCSPIPLFTLLAMARAEAPLLGERTATALGIMFMLALVAAGISFFIRTNQFTEQSDVVENEDFELAYGVRGAIQDRLEKFRGRYNLTLSLAISLFVFCTLPFLFSIILSASATVTLMMLNVTIAMVAIGVYKIVPVSAHYDALNQILAETGVASAKSERTKRAEKLAAFYWPLLVAIYLGWSLWTMDWGVTWIIWPVGAVLFAASVGLMELMQKKDNR